MCSLYLFASLHLHACGFVAESSVYACVCGGGGRGVWGQWI